MPYGFLQVSPKTGDTTKSTHRLSRVVIELFLPVGSRKKNIKEAA